MAKFKTGVRVVVTASNEELRNAFCDERIKTGGSHKITEMHSSGKYCCLDEILNGFVRLDWIKLAKPKWSIYTNDDIPWCDLNDKQKGKLLLAGHAGIEFIMSKHSKDGAVRINYPSFKADTAVYKAVKGSK